MGRDCGEQGWRSGWGGRGGRVEADEEDDD